MLLYILAEMKEYAEKGVNPCNLQTLWESIFPSKDLGVQKNALNGRIGNVNNT